MNKPIRTVAFSFLLGTVLLATTGCPGGLDYPLVEPGTTKIDPHLLGTWETYNSDAEMFQVQIEKSEDSDYFYYIDVLVTSDDNYMLGSTYFKAWVTTVAGKDFLIATPDDGLDNGYFHYNYSFENGSLFIRDIGLGLDTDKVYNTESLRTELSAYLQKDRSLIDPIKYTKISD